MNETAFYNCKYFLEQKINEFPDNPEFIRAYIVLIEQKTKFDISYFSQTSDVQKNWNDNQTKMSISWQETQNNSAALIK